MWFQYLRTISSQTISMNFLKEHTILPRLRSVYLNYAVFMTSTPRFSLISLYCLKVSICSKTFKENKNLSMSNTNCKRSLLRSSTKVCQMMIKCLTASFTIVSICSMVTFQCQGSNMRTKRSRLAQQLAIMVKMVVNMAGLTQ